MKRRMLIGRDNRKDARRAVAVFELEWKELLEMNEILRKTDDYGDNK